MSDTDRTQIEIDRELIQRAINQASSKHAALVANGDAVALPRWAIVMDLFCYGRQASKSLCWKYGYDPDAMVGSLTGTDGGEVACE